MFSIRKSKYLEMNDWITCCDPNVLRGVYSIPLHRRWHVEGFHLYIEIAGLHAVIQMSCEGLTQTPPPPSARWAFSFIRF